MITPTGIKKSVLYGIASGILLTIILKIIESLTLYKVYTLLLNIDYIPLLNKYQFPELIEVGFHLIISITLSICLYIFIIKTNVVSRNNIILLSTVVCILIGAAIFPTTALSTRTPEITSIPSILYWIVSHAIYGSALGYLFAGWMTKD